MEAHEVDHGLEQRRSPQALLQLRQGEPPVGQQGALRIESPPDELPPGAWLRQLQTQGEGVEEEAQDPFAALFLQPAVHDQAGDHLHLSAQQGEDAHVGRQKHALERDTGELGQPVQLAELLGRD